MLVDDHAVVRMGFRLLLESTPDIKVVAEADTGEQALKGYQEARPDVVVMDLSMPGMGGIEAVKRLLAKDKQARILVLSAHDDTLHPRRVLEAGALGYLSKRSAPEELIQAVRHVAAGKVFLEPAIAQQLAIQQVTGTRNPVEVLSPREFELFLLLAQGKTVAEIAEMLYLSPRTVGTHLYNIKQKLNASNAAELALIAMRAGLLEP
ncbi:MAG: DNA-binding response regulator [Azospira oryzae]|uniref:Response regulator transcription factor n=2 Tax=Pelomicrobium methylotrophicum TaxID=2602750 RepID=A0A5C7EZY6_9PROT|nr:MAG: DNA-binding response regulator [Azospira oryzae]PZP79328.1 MAG: DNA-binding response regulator [Azospira oryzae]TXF12705.1 response regulator transcription factor [Pelomicrobium methylotrophicum]